MSSEQVKILSDKYRVVSGLVLIESSRLDQAQATSRYRQATIDEQNDRDFLHFEAVIPSISPALDQLNQAAEEQGPENKYGLEEDADNRPVTQSETVLANWFKWFGSLLPSRNQGQQSLEPGHGGGTSDVEDMIKSVVETGTLSPNAQQILALPTQNSREAVVAWTKVNKEFEILQTSGLRLAEREERNAPTRTATEGGDAKSPSESLFEHLAQGICCHEEHGALLQLSIPRDQGVFQMFLSCCSIVEPDRRCAEYHKTSCTLESSSTQVTDGTMTPLNVCAEVKLVQKLQVPLQLSFNSSRIWHQFQGRDFLPKESTNHRSLECLLQSGQLKTAELEAGLKKFRLALRLASSLSCLYLGPWLQHSLTAKDIFVFHNGTAGLTDKLDEPYVHCLLQKDWQRTNPVIEAFKPDDSEPYSTFFLSFAQLLIDIAKGETDPNPPWINPEPWYIALLNEVSKRFQDEMMEAYCQAIKGCMFFSMHWRSEGTRTGNKVLRAQQIINKEIVEPLQRNLNKWEEQMTQKNICIDKEDGEGSLNAIGQARTQLQRGPGRQSSTRHQTTAVFTLFSSEDEEYPALTDSTVARGEHDFTTCMENFLETYIQKPSKTASRNVRVAILDTGFYVDDDDHLLQAAECRVKELKCFVGSNNDCTDRHGHGTQVARLLLKHAPEADIYVAKISNSRTFNETKVEQLVEALRWAGTQADIINLSFGLGQNCHPFLGAAIDDLVKNKKLIFAAASNNGGNGSRPWPAKHPGVFCIHATNERGVANLEMNPTPMSVMDNFATLGENIESFWCGQKRCISGTSFATPVAAAIAANVLHFARTHLKKEDADQFMRYGVMRTLMRNRMTDNGRTDGVYHYIKPWAYGLWTKGATDGEVAEVLKQVLTYSM